MHGVAALNKALPGVSARSVMKNGQTMAVKMMKGLQSSLQNITVPVLCAEESLAGRQFLSSSER